MPFESGRWPMWFWISKFWKKKLHFSEWLILKFECNLDNHNYAGKSPPVAMLKAPPEPRRPPTSLTKFVNWAKWNGKATRELCREHNAGCFSSSLSSHFLFQICQLLLRDFYSIFNCSILKGSSDIRWGLPDCTPHTHVNDYFKPFLEPANSWLHHSPAKSSPRRTRLSFPRSHSLPPCNFIKVSPLSLVWQHSLVLYNQKVNKDILSQETIRQNRRAKVDELGGPAAHHAESSRQAIHIHLGGHWPKYFLD